MVKASDNPSVLANAMSAAKRVLEEIPGELGSRKTPARTA